MNRKVDRLRPDYRRDNTGSFVTAIEEQLPVPSPEPGAMSTAESSLQIPSFPRGDTSTSSLLSKPDRGLPAPAPEQPEQALRPRVETGPSFVKFNVPDDSKRAEIQARARLTQASLRRKGSRLRKAKGLDGEIVKMDKMLVRVDSTIAEISDDFDENEAHKIDSRTTEKWREYMVVCRDCVDDEDPDVPFVLQIYKTRVSLHGR